MKTRTSVMGLIVLMNLTAWSQTPEDVSQQFEPILDSITVDEGIQMSVDLQVVDANYLVAVKPYVIGALACDEQGNTYPISNSSDYPYYKTLTYRTDVDPDCLLQETEGPNDCFIEVLQPFHLSLDISKDPNGNLPTPLSEVSWTNNVLLAKYYCLVDIPFIAGDYWYELAGGSYLCIDLAESSDGEFNYAMTLETQEASLLEYFTIRVDSDIPSLSIGSPQVLDQNGQAIETSSSYSEGHSSGTSTGTDTYYLSGGGTCVNDCTVSTIRITLARDLYKATASFTLTDIPVSTLGACRRININHSTRP